MIQNIPLGAFVFGSVLLLLSIIGGNFKIFGAEIPVTIGRIGRLISGIIGTLFILVALMFSLSLTTTNNIMNMLLDYKTKKIVDDLAIHFKQSRAKLQDIGIVDFSIAEKDIKDLDLNNGHALYFNGEIVRIKDTTHFTPKGCIKIPLSEDFDLDKYQNNFYRYLNNAASFSKNKIEGVGADICYDRTNGYCLERIAWIHHLLANDLYEVAKVSSDPKIKRARLEKAYEHAEAALEYQAPDSRTTGFDNCIPTRKLIKNISDELRLLKD
jgi:hypothetical protein